MDCKQDPYRRERFKNGAEALRWLQARGQISRGKFYEDCNSGHITIYPDKTVSKFDVAMYAEKHFAKFVRTAQVQPSTATGDDDMLNSCGDAESPEGQPEGRGMANRNVLKAAALKGSVQTLNNLISALEQQQGKMQQQIAELLGAVNQGRSSVSG